jgi:glycosyltransferase involved in cell wall biosynthesis
MRFLFLATRYSASEADPYMTDELAEALIARGHEVDVLVINWDSRAASPSREIAGRSGERIVVVTPRAVRGLGRLAFRASKLLLSSHSAASAMRRHFRDARHDAVIAWTPALSVAAALRQAARSGIRRRVLIIFDFFPMCHRDAGIIRSQLVYAVAKRLEDRLYRLFTGFIANLPGNVAYLERHYPVPAGAHVVCSPIWTGAGLAEVEDRETVRRRLALPLDCPIAIFGGQFCEGRGIEQMIEAARIGDRRGSRTLYLFMGDGPLRPLIEEAAISCANIRLEPPVPRSDYLSVVAACDVGLVATVKEFTSWAFPSKTIDYLRAGIPIVTAVEPGSDFPALLEPYGLSENVESGDPAAFQAAVGRLAAKRRDRQRVLKSASACLDEIFDVRHAVNAVLRALGEPCDLAKDDRKTMVTRIAVTA